MIYTSTPQVILTSIFPSRTTDDQHAGADPRGKRPFCARVRCGADQTIRALGPSSRWSRSIVVKVLEQELSEAVEIAAARLGSLASRGHGGSRAPRRAGSVVCAGSRHRPDRPGSGLVGLDLAIALRRRKGIGRLTCRRLSPGRSRNSRRDPAVIPPLLLARLPLVKLPLAGRIADRYPSAAHHQRRMDRADLAPERKGPRAGIQRRKGKRTGAGLAEFCDQNCQTPVLQNFEPMH